MTKVKEARPWRSETLNFMESAPSVGPSQASSRGSHESFNDFDLSSILEEDGTRGIVAQHNSIIVCAFYPRVVVVSAKVSPLLRRRHGVIGAAEKP